MRVLELVATEARAPDQIVRVTGLGAATVASALVELELAGAAVEADGLYRSALRERAPPGTPPANASSRARSVPRPAGVSAGTVKTRSAPRADYDRTRDPAALARR